MSFRAPLADNVIRDFAHLPIRHRTRGSSRTAGACGQRARCRRPRRRLGNSTAFAPQGDEEKA